MTVLIKAKVTVNKIMETEIPATKKKKKLMQVWPPVVKSRHGSSQIYTQELKLTDM